MLDVTGWRGPTDAIVVAKSDDGRHASFAHATDTDIGGVLAREASLVFFVFLMLLDALSKDIGDDF